jgi:glutamate/tyrosine decarboxylase-like PLP-dependent enzyme
MVYAALRSLGRGGVAELVERCCALARRLAERVGDEVEVLNDVVLNQVLLAVDEAVVRELQEEGTLWAGGTVWHGRPALRFSVSNWSTTEADIDRSAEAILSAARRAR